MMRRMRCLGERWAGRIGVLSAVCALVAAAPSSYGTDVKLSDWEFSRDRQNWTPVRVPHDWAIGEAFDVSVDAQKVMVREDGETKECLRVGRTGALPWIGEGWYRRVVAIPSGTRVAELWFDGARSSPEVFADGKRIGGWENGYTPFVVRLPTDRPQVEVLVRLVNLPQSSRWYPGAGLIRPVVLRLDPAARVEDVFVRTERIENGKAYLRVTSPCGDRTFVVENPRLWTPEDPYLYRLEPEGIRYGIRLVDWKDGVFRLNGKARKFRGVCLHNDLGPVGAGVNEAALRRQVRLLKEIGCDAIRTAHNIPSTMQMDIYDEMGMMVMAESFDEWREMKCSNGYHRVFDTWWRRDLEALVRFHRNHPSLVMWSIGNEIHDQCTKEGTRLTEQMIDLVHVLDPTRPVTQGHSWLPQAIEAGGVAAMDVPGVTYRLPFYPALHAASRHGGVLGAETASTVSTRGWYALPDEPGACRRHSPNQCSSYDLEYCPWSNLPDDDWAVQDDCPWTMGEFVWTGFDYYGEPAPYDRHRSRSSYFGIYDIAGLPKDRAWLYRSRWRTDAPTLHILPHWNWTPGMRVPVYVYTSYPEAELFVNGRSRGRRTFDRTSRLDRYRLRWRDVPYEPGELKVVAYDGEGRVAATECVRTAGRPARLRLSVDRTELSGADDLAFVTVDVIDAAGVVCPLATNRVEFSVSGAGRFRSAENGDPTDLDRLSAPSRCAFAGRLVAVVEASEASGRIAVDVRSAGLEPASLSLQNGGTHGSEGNASSGPEASSNDRLLTDGKMVPSAVYRWENRPIEIVTAFDAPREVGGVRIMSGRSWVNCCVRKASFYALDGDEVKELGAYTFGPANTFKEIWTAWKPVRCRGVKMVIEDTWDRERAYYETYSASAFCDVFRMFGGPVWDLWATGGWASLKVDAETIAHPQAVDWIGGERTVQIAELSYFGAEVPDDLPRPNAPDEAFPRARLLRDWAYQAAAPTGNVSLVANTTADTTKPDRIGRDISSVTVDVPSCEARRREFLKAFREKAARFVYVKHFIIGDSILYGTDDLTDWPWEEWRRCPDTTVPRASGLYLATIREDGSVAQEELCRTPVTGVIRDPAVSPDATRVAFSMRRTMDGDDYHLYVLDLKSRQLRQITFDGEYEGRKYPASDIEPCWLPDGSLVFQSTRCGQVLDCWPLPNTNLFRCEADGSRIRRLGFDEVSTFFPQLLEDGRILFSRWEYNDRNSGYCNGLFTMFPDGTRQLGYALTNSPKPTSPLHARGIPDSTRVMFVDCGHHTGQKGRLAEVDPSAGDDYEAWTYSPSNAVYGGVSCRPTWRARWQGGTNVTIASWPYGMRTAAAVRNLPGTHYLAGASTDGSAGRAPYPLPWFFKYPTMETGYAVVGPQWAYPYPLGEGRFLVSFLPEGDRFHRGPFSRNLGVYAMDETGRRELLAYDAANHCLQPVPVVARPLGPRIRSSEPDYSRGLSVVSIQDVYRGAAVKGLKRGTVRKIRVVAIGYRAAYIGWNSQYLERMVGTDGKIGSPVAVGNGTYDVKHVLGEADVEADGSCSFLVPSRTPLYYQLIDEKGCMVQTMRSWVTMMPGEMSSCIGCHEYRNDAGEPKRALALMRPPQKLKPAVPGLGHPLMAELEKKSPIDDLGVFMGVNRPERVDGNGETGAFSFPRHVQPILDRSCVRCHDGSRPEPPLNKLGGAPEKATCFDLRGVPGNLPSSDDNAHRAYTRGYLNLSCYGFCNDMINFSHGCDQVPFRQPYAFGASQSRYWQMLAKGHPDANGDPRVRLTDDELKTLAIWIDLGVPFVGGYCERNTWTDVQKARYLWFQNKRVYFSWQELNDIRRERGLGPVPIDGYVPGVDRPGKMEKWYD